MMHALVAGVALAAISLPIGGPVHRKTEEGNRKYAEKSYEDALRAYTEAQVGAPEAAELHYDIGNVLYRQENWDGAAEAYARALLSAPPTLAPSASYNLGNALYRREKFDDAARAYRRTLEAVPGDRDAKRNLELALRAAAQARERKKEDQEQGQQKDGEQQQQQQSPSGGDEREDGKQQPPEPSARPGEDRKDDGKSRRRAGEMTPEEARSLLDSLGEQEKAALKKEAERRARLQDSEPAEDW